MRKRAISTEELWKKVQENRLREYRLREPYMIAFRATEEEIKLREAENAEQTLLDNDEFRQFAERLARLGREAVRFERYLIRQGFYPRIPRE